MPRDLKAISSIGQSRRTLWILHGVAIFLNLSLLLAPTNYVWKIIDDFTFWVLNSSVVHHPVQQVFWAVSNIKITDVFGALFLLGAFFVYISEAKNEEKKLRIAQLLYTILWFEISIYFCKQVLTPICEHFLLSRHGPTIVYSNALMLSHVAPWAKIKDSSLFCYPADHAAIVMQWCALFWAFAGWKRGLFVSAVSTLLVLPRLISGGHWFSDLAVGSGSIVLVALAWAIHSPLKHWLINRLYRCVQKTAAFFTPMERIPT